MKIYVDVVLFLNFAFDFLLLLSVSFILKRRVSMERICLGAFLGSLSVFFLFLPLTTFSLFLAKVGISFLMILGTFSFRDIRYFLKNMVFLYIHSFVLGGCLYALNVQFSYKQQGLVFFHNGMSINVIVLIALSPIILYLYYKQLKDMKQKYGYYYKTKIFISGEMISCVAFLDTGNQLVDPYFGRPIILINPGFIKKEEEHKMILVPYQTITNNGFLHCIKADKIEIENQIYHNFFVGILTDPIRMNGVDCILNSKIFD